MLNNILSVSLALLMISVIGTGIWVVVQAIRDDAATVTHREALPSMERVGAVVANNTTLSLWTFDFEDRRCLWATARVGRGGRGGLTCWEIK